MSPSRGRRLSRGLADTLLDLLYPTFCVLCRKKLPPGPPSICPDCRRTLPSAAGTRIRGDYFSECVAALRYTGNVREAILRYKFRGAECYCAPFGELLAARVYEDLAGRFDTLSYVPLAPDRRRERGYDQALLLARNAASRLLMPCTPLLEKRRGVRAQSRTSDAGERKRNIAGAYLVPDPGAAAGRRILLIDDVVTTGSTLSECARVLLLAGAENVVCAALAAAVL